MKKAQHFFVNYHYHLQMKLYKILLVDDIENNIQAISACLLFSGEPYKILTANNGRIGCELAEKEQPDLIIMDWIMPEMDGYEALQWIKKQPTTSDIPVIILTSVDSPKQIEAAFTAGASDYLRSPIDKTELLVRVRSTLALIDSHRQIKEQHHRLQLRNSEIAQQRELLEQQSIEIQLTNKKLQVVNQALESKNLQLMELNYEKNELLGIAAHDLKNPISNIKMLAKILHEESQTLSAEEIKEYSGDILYDSVRMFDLVKKLLDITAIERGGITLEPTFFDIAIVIQNVVENYHPRALIKNIDLKFVSSHTELPVFADQSAIIQVFDNLISNAVKYSPLQSVVTISVKPNVYAGEIEVIRCEIADQGPGLTSDDQVKLFGKFARLSAQPTGGEHSTGLGLSIVKKMVDVMEGKIWCESTPGKGATFIVELPKRLNI